MSCSNLNWVSDSKKRCGRCKSCRLYARKVWAGRILLEAYYHPKSVFITLTYNDDNVPIVDGTPVLRYEDATRFLERLRFRTRSIQPLRYFLVGEYGETTWRPHYHLVVFGHGVEIEPLVNLAWTEAEEHQGFTQVGPLTYDRALYIANYTVKKMTREGDPWLKGRPPEFARMSLKPGIGVPAIGWLADALGRQQLMEDGKYTPLLKIRGDVFSTVRIQGKIFPLGRYLRTKLRQAMGLSDNPRDRALQLGRFTVDGEIIEETETHSENHHPYQDLADASTPFYRQQFRALQADREAKAKAIEEKAERQSSLSLTTGGRI